jgi:hypothetical protein
LPQKPSNDDPVHKQMIYFRKEKKKPVASSRLTRELRGLAGAGKIKSAQPAGEKPPVRVKKRIAIIRFQLALDRKLTLL